MQIEETVELFLYSLILLGLVIEAIEDIREKKIWLPVIGLELPALFGFNCWLGRWDIWFFVASVGVGAAFYLLSVITRGQIGKGDALIFCMIGAGLGLAESLLVIYLTFVLSFLAAVFLWLVKRVGKSYRMPLVPFILCAYVVVVGSRIWELRA